MSFVIRNTFQAFITHNKGVKENCILWINLDQNFIWLPVPSWSRDQEKRKYLQLMKTTIRRFLCREYFYISLFYKLKNNWSNYPCLLCLTFNIFYPNYTLCVYFLFLFFFVGPLNYIWRSQDYLNLQDSELTYLKTKNILYSRKEEKKL